MYKNVGSRQLRNKVLEITASLIISLENKAEHKIGNALWLYKINTINNLFYSMWLTA